MYPTIPRFGGFGAPAARWLLLAAALTPACTGTTGDPEAPPPPGVTLSPDSPTTTDDLILVVTGRDEPDEYRVRWLVDGQARDEVDDASTIPAAETTKGETWEVVVVAVDAGGLESEPSAAAVTVVDTPPTATISISPAEPRTTDLLDLAIEVGDADDDPVTVAVTWSIDGEAAPTYAGLLQIPAAATTRGQTWQASAVPHDGEEAGEAVHTLAVIANTPPAVVSVDLSPETPREGDTLTAIVSTQDEDGDEVSASFTWYVDGAPVSTNQSLDSSAWNKRDVVYVVVTPDDGTDEGLPFHSAPVTVRGSPPAITGVAIDPPTGDETTTFVCVPEGWSDPDPADTEAYAFAWTVNGIPVATTELLDGTLFDKGDQIACTATPDDGEVLGAAFTSAGVTILNSPPSALDATIGPLSPREADTLAVAVSGWSDPDPADTEGYTYAWYAGAALRGTTATLTGADFDKGEHLHVVVTPWDGTDPGEGVGSNTVTAVNAAPAITGVTIDPPTGDETTTFVCVPEGWSDPDPADTEAYAYAWTVNDTPVATTELLNGTLFDKGDRIACTATPDDGEVLGAAFTSAGVTILNSPPSALEATIGPVSPREADTLEVAVSGWSDPDPADTEGYTYAWYAGAELRGTAPTLTGADFDKGEDIHVVVTPWDGTDPGEGVGSNAATAVNTAPSATSVALSPATLFADTSATAGVSGWFDPDPADTEGYVYDWFVDGVAVATHLPTLDHAAFARGQEVAITVTPDDGEALGSSVNAGPFTVQNRPPSAPTVRVLPSAPLASEALTCELEAPSDDVDGDDVVYDFLWLQDDVPTSWSATGAADDEQVVVPAGTIAVGEVWTCEVTPDDGFDQGAAGSADLTVVCGEPEVPAGMVGIEGCQPLSESLPSIGFAIYAPYSDWTESTDGDVASATLSDYGDLVIYRRGGVPGNDVGSSMVFEIEPSYGVYFDELAVYMQDDWTTCGMGIRQGENQAFFTDINNAIWFTATPGQHVYDMRILPDQAGVELLVDGVSLGVLPGGRMQGDGSPFMLMNTRGGAGTGINVDNFSYTPSP